MPRMPARNGQPVVWERTPPPGWTAAAGRGCGASSPVRDGQPWCPRPVDDQCQSAGLDYRPRHHHGRVRFGEPPASQRAWPRWRAILEKGAHLSPRRTSNRRGVQTRAAQWALEHGVPCVIHASRWQERGKAAGFERNTAMERAAQTGAGRMVLVADREDAGTRHLAAACSPPTTSPSGPPLPSRYWERGRIAQCRKIFPESAAISSRNFHKQPYRILGPPRASSILKRNSCISSKAYRLAGVRVSTHCSDIALANGGAFR